LKTFGETLNEIGEVLLILSRSYKHTSEQKKKKRNKKDVEGKDKGN
jgi:hypothetical protein